MSNYTKTTNFSTKDSLPSGDPNKIVKGAEINTEFDNIATAVATKSNLESPAFTGTVTIPTADINGGAIDGTTIGGATAAPVTSTTLTANTSLNIAGDGATVTGIKDEDDMASNSATKLATQQSIKAYVDSQVTAQDLDVTTDSGTIAIDLDSETLTVTGGTGLSSSATGNAVTLDIDSTVATLTGTQTLTNKTLTTPVISGNLTTDGTIDGRDVAADGSKLDGIESGATADQTAAEIRTLVESATDSNVFTDADHSKLNGIEANADVTDTTNVVAALSAGTGISLSAGGEIANTAPDQTVALTGAGGTTISGTYPNFTISSSAGGGETLAQTLAIGNTTGGADISFGDTDKATFGASADLQIYHDGSNSFIQDVGTGDLIIYGTGEDLAKFKDDGAVELYHDGSQKLATTSTGVDVTGTATMDGLTVSDGTETTAIPATADRLSFTGASLNYIQSAGALFVQPTGDLVLNGSGSEIMRLKSGNVGIGTSNPQRELEVTGTGNVYARITAPTDDDSAVLELKNTQETWQIRNQDTNNDALEFIDDTATRLTIKKDGNVGIGTASPSQDLEINKNASNVNLNIRSSDTGNATLLFGDQSDASISSITQDNSSNALIFKNNNQQERMRIDSSGNLLVGKTTSSSATAGITLEPAGAVVATRDGGECFIANRKSSDGAIIQLRKDQSTVGSIGTRAGDLSIGTGDTGLNFWDASNSIIPENLSTGAARDNAINIGSSGVRFKDLHLSGSGYFSSNGNTSGGNIMLGSTTNATNKYAVITSQSYNSSTDTEGFAAIATQGISGTNLVTIGGGIGEVDSATQLRFYTSSATGTRTGSERMRIDSSGNLGIGTSSPSYKLSVSGNIGLTDGVSTASHTLVGGNYYIQNTGAYSTIFQTNAAERMRIDSSGNLLVGTTTTYPGVSGLGGNVKGFMVESQGSIFASRNDGNIPAYFNRGTDGAIISLRRASTAYGTIGAVDVGNGFSVYMATDAKGLRIENIQGTGAVIPCNGSGAILDNSIDLGKSTARFDDVYATNGTIQTSDRNEKQDIEVLSDAEQRVAVACKGLLRKFRWKSAVEEKGDEARIHFGIIAQDLQDAFTAEGLDAGDYAMFINTTWTDEETGEERSRMGVRYSELLAFIISAI